MPYDAESDMMEALRERMEGDQMATMSDAHREWHLNAGVPMGQPGCPQDACHPVDDYDEEPEPQFRCGNHGWNAHVYHHSVEDVRRCFASGSKAPAKAAPLADPGTVTEQAPYGTTHVTMVPESSVWHSTGPSGPDGHWAVRCPGATCPVVIQQAQREAPAPAAPAPAAKPDRVSVEEIQSWAKIPVTNNDHAFYALRSTVDGMVTCFRIRRPSVGKYKGRTYVDRQSGDNFTGMPFRESAQVLSAIVKNPAAAAVLYGKTVKRCSLCHRSLTDEKNKGSDGLTSVERGIGPKCAKKVGML